MTDALTADDLCEIFGETVPIAALNLIERRAGRLCDADVRPLLQTMANQRRQQVEGLDGAQRRAAEIVRLSNVFSEGCTETKFDNKPAAVCVPCSADFMERVRLVVEGKD